MPLGWHEGGRWRAAAAFWCLALALGVSVAARAEESANSEVRLKSAFLYKFAGYVEWPAGAPETPLKFGIIGDDELAAALTRLVRERGEGARPVEVIRLKAFDPLPPLHVLFIGRSESDRLAPLIRFARGTPILVVTDTEGALALGSMINFTLTGGHMRFEVGLGAAKRNGLTLSARLLAVAQIVSTRAP
jgi:hypothetical protein